MSDIKKILIVRFSSIGDIVLTSPVIRCLSQQIPEIEIHYVCKQSFETVLINNPYVHKLYTFKEDISELFEELSSEHYDLVLDLHKNLRSSRLKRQLKIKSFVFDKLNIKKFLVVNFKLSKLLPPKHIVDRYFETVQTIGVKNDGKGLDYFLDENDNLDLSKLIVRADKKFIALVIGGSYYTKKIPLNKLLAICALAKLPIILLGGKEDQAIAEQILKQFPDLINGCGSFTINQSASIISQSEWVITSDTGMMHIASAFNKKIISIWGNTIPEFGMSPYLPKAKNRLLQVSGLECRPCSKLGYHTCPLGHFKCMNDVDISVVEALD